MQVGKDSAYKFRLCLGYLDRSLSRTTHLVLRLLPCQTGAVGCGREGREAVGSRPTPGTVLSTSQLGKAAALLFRRLVLNQRK